MPKVEQIHIDLPCKVGTKIWFENRGGNADTSKISRYVYTGTDEFGEQGLYFTVENEKCLGRAFEVKDLGYTWFWTLEDLQKFQSRRKKQLSETGLWQMYDFNIYDD